ncbi:hypothetical protein K3495_g6314 [Podosphaera aphanis]|nr:hypothetical protein K3495_g6314 [Podosphaera aphanis]
MLGSNYTYLFLAFFTPVLALPSPQMFSGSLSIAESTLSAVAAKSAPVTFSVTGENAAYPRSNFLSNGDIIGSYTAFPPGGLQVLTIVTSVDNGASWKFTGTVARKPVKSGSLDNGFPLQLPTGRVIIAFRNHDVDDKGAPTVYRITLCSSDNNGATWQFLSDAVVVTATPTNNGVWEPFLRNDPSSGALQLYYSHERSNLDQDSVMLVSQDGGMNWCSEKRISGVTEAASRDGMVGIAELGGSNLMAIFETNENGGPFSLSTVSSSDNGNTWGNRKSIYVAEASKNAGAPQIVKVGKSLVVSFMTNEDYPINPNANWIENADAKLLVSNDDGATWTKSTVFKAPAFWPGLMPLRDQGSFLYLAGQNGKLFSQTVVLP